MARGCGVDLAGAPGVSQPGAPPPDPRGILTTMKGLRAQNGSAVQAEAPMTAHGESTPSPRTCPPEAGCRSVPLPFIVVKNTSAGGIRRRGRRLGGGMPWSR